MDIFDEYNRKARIFPAALLISPMALFLPIMAADIFSLFNVFLGTGLIATAGLALATVIVRKYGVSYEEKFLIELGGWPSTILLRWRDDTKSDGYKKLIHQAVQSKLGVKLLSKNQELENNKEADKRINDAFGILKNSLRGDTSRLVHQDNIDYGFARNMFGSRWLWIAISLLAILSCVAIPYIRQKDINWVFVAISNLFLISIFLVEWGVIKQHVKHCAFSYASHAWDEIWKFPDREEWK